MNIYQNLLKHIKPTKNLKALGKLTSKLLCVTDDYDWEKLSRADTKFDHKELESCVKKF